MKYILRFVLFMLLACPFATVTVAQTVGTWTIYPAYDKIEKMVTVGKTQWCISCGNLFTHDTETEELRTFTTQEGLTSVGINNIAYAPQSHKLILTYSDSNIDLLDVGTEKVYNIAALTTVNSNNHINHIYIDGKQAWICTGFGILTINTENRKTLSSYIYNEEVKACAIDNGKLYVAFLTKDNTINIRCASLTDNLYDKSKFVPVSNEEYAKWEAELINKPSVPIPSDIPVPNGPHCSRIGYLTYNGKQLLTASGCILYENVPGFTSIYEDGKWTEIEHIGGHPYYGYHNTAMLLSDPTDTNRYAIVSQGMGVRIHDRSGKCIDYYRADNSPLSYAANITYEPDAYTWVQAGAYDKNGTLWMANNLTDSTIVYRTKDGKWGKYYHKDFTNIYHIRFLIPYGNYIITGSCANSLEDRSLTIIDTKGTLDPKDDRSKVYLAPFKQQDGIEFLPSINCAVADMNGSVWMGSSSGIAVIPRIEEFFDKDFHFTQIKVNREDGSGLADYLFNNVEVLSIAVDGANRKWIGTSGQGLYLMSSDGQKQLQHFTTEDSPLPSNVIPSIAVNPVTGMVMIGTDKGLVSYMADAVNPELELDTDNIVAYPNPVPADYNGFITIKGLTDNAEVKITTVSGQLVYQGHSNGGMMRWSGRTPSGRRAATGVYNVIANTEDGSEAVVTRIVITN